MHRFSARRNDARIPMVVRWAPGSVVSPGSCGEQSRSETGGRHRRGLRDQNDVDYAVFAAAEGEQRIEVERGV